MKKSYEKMEAVKVTFDAKEQMAVAACQMVQEAAKYWDNNGVDPIGVCQYDYNAAGDDFYYGAIW